MNNLLQNPFLFMLLLPLLASRDRNFGILIQPFSLRLPTIPLPPLCSTNPLPSISFPPVLPLPLPLGIARCGLGPGLVDHTPVTERSIPPLPPCPLLPLLLARLLSLTLLVFDHPLPLLPFLPPSSSPSGSSSPTSSGSSFPTYSGSSTSPPSPPYHQCQALGCWQCGQCPSSSPSSELTSVSWADERVSTSKLLLTSSASCKILFI